MKVQTYMQMVKLKYNFPLRTVVLTLLIVIGLLNTTGFPGTTSFSPHAVSIHYITGKPSFTAHFPGEYGAQALTNLSSWTSSLFERTMLAMREKTQKACLLPSGQVNTVDPACKEALLHSKMVEPRNFEKYNLFDPFVNCPNDEPLRRMGGDPNVMNNDGGKWLCMDILEPPCTIFSIGSNGDFTFEESMLNATECAVYTFDCTFAGASIHPRHQYIQRCLGSAEKAEKDAWFLTLQVAAAQLGVEKINLLKIDIEGYEYDALSVWSQADLALPEQVAIEIHHSEVLYYGTSYHKTDEFSNLLWPMHDLSQSDLSLFFNHLTNLGYGIASREDNPIGACCSEFLLLKVGDWA